MTYPSREEIQSSLRHGTNEYALSQRHGITIAEIVQIDLYGEVRPRTKAWADALRARLEAMRHA